MKKKKKKEVNKSKQVSKQNAVVKQENNVKQGLKEKQGLDIKQDISEKQETNKKAEKEVKEKPVLEKNPIWDFLKKKSFVNWHVIVSWVLCIVLLLMLIVSLMKNTKKETKLDITNYPKGSFKGVDFLTKNYPIFNDVVIVGDSYSYYLAEDVGEDVVIYACPGLKLAKLANAFDVASRVDKKYAVIFIGPNDLVEQTQIEVFKRLLDRYVTLLQNSGKKVLIASYLHSEYTEEAKKSLQGGLVVEDYDNAIRQICEEKNACYVDTTDLNNYKYDKRILWDGTFDGLHFNQEFNIKFINRVYEYIYDMELSGQ